MNPGCFYCGHVCKLKGRRQYRERERGTDGAKPKKKWDRMEYKDT